MEHPIAPEALIGLDSFSLGFVWNHMNFDDSDELLLAHAKKFQALKDRAGSSVDLTEKQKTALKEAVQSIDLRSVFENAQGDIKAMGRHGDGCTFLFSSAMVAAQVEKSLEDYLERGISWVLNRQGAVCENTFCLSSRDINALINLLYPFDDASQNIKRANELCDDTRRSGERKNIFFQQLNLSSESLPGSAARVVNSSPIYHARVEVAAVSAPETFSNALTGR